MIKKHLALIALITSVSTATMAECGKLDLPHAPKDLLISAIVFFLVIFLGYYLFTTLANKNKENETASFLFSAIGAILEIVGIGAAGYLSTKYVEFAILSAFVISLGAIEILLGKEDADKEEDADID
jgi:glucose uptake protein GlcU